MMTVETNHMRWPLYKTHLLPEFVPLIAQVFASGRIASGPNVAEFQRMLGEYLGNPSIATAGDVSTALSISLFQAGVKPGDDVLMSPLVCLSTSSPVRTLFANIRWCDVDPETGNLDASDIPRRVTSRTKAIVVYHWAGNPADLEPIHSAAKAHGLAVIEDAGEALGAEYRGRKIGATGSDYTVFSFYANRHLTTIDGAAISCGTQVDSERVRSLTRYGIDQTSFRREDGEINPESDIAVAGWNSHLNHVAATIGVAQMKHVSDIVTRHQQNGLYFDGRFGDMRGLTVLKRPARSMSSYWVYTFLAERRDSLLKRLRSRGIHASKVHIRNDWYSGFGVRENDLPGVDHFSDRYLSIPCGWWVTEEDRIQIADIVCEEAAND
jgi:perosamine synthetase